MIKESDSSYGVLIYADNVSKKRLIKVVPIQYRKAKVVVEGVKTYLHLGEITSDVIENPNYYSFDIRKGLTYVGGPIGESTQQRLVVKKIMINYLEKLENIKLMYKNAFIRPILDEDIYDSLVLYDINTFERNKSVSPLLQAMYDRNKNKFTTIDIYVDFLKRRYEDLSYQMAYLHKFEADVKKLIERKRFDEANVLMDEEFEKRSL